MSDAFDPTSSPEPLADPRETSTAPAGEAAGEVELDVRSFLPDGVELGDPDEDPPEAAAVDVRALEQIERDLDAVDAAIAALDAGTYGLDPSSGQPIDDALLAEDPTFRG